MRISSSSRTRGIVKRSKSQEMVGVYCKRKTEISRTEDKKNAMAHAGSCETKQQNASADEPKM